MKFPRKLKTKVITNARKQQIELPNWAIDMAEFALDHRPERLYEYGYCTGRNDVKKHPLVNHEVATAIMYVLVSAERGRNGSYSYKHEAESWGRNFGFSSYVSNGAMILGALFVAAHFPRVRVLPDYQQSGQGNSPNAVIIIESRSTYGINEYPDFYRWKTSDGKPGEMHSLMGSAQCHCNFIVDEEDEDTEPVRIRRMPKKATLSIGEAHETEYDLGRRRRR